MYNNEEQGLFRSKLETVSSSTEYIPPVQNASPGCSIRTSLMLFTGQSYGKACMLIPRVPGYICMQATQGHCHTTYCLSFFSYIHVL